MKAISIRQPWAYAIVMGYKPVENRKARWSLRGPTWIHAGKAEDVKSFGYVFDLIADQTGAALADVRADYHSRREGASAVGGIVGMASIIDCVQGHPSKWWAGPYGLLMRDPVPLRAAVPCRGELAAFDIPDAIDERCRRNLAVMPSSSQGMLGL